MTKIILPYFSLNALLDLKREDNISSFLSATIRGGFGYTLKSIVCTFKKSRCIECKIKDGCIYSFLFETSPPPHAPRLKKYYSIPRPFVLRTFMENNSLFVKIVLIGSAINTFPFFVYTLNKLGKKGLGKKRVRFKVDKITSNNNEIVYPINEEMECKKLAPQFIEIFYGEQSDGEVVLDFKTPLVLRRDGKIIFEFDKEVFLKTLLRRVTNLNAFYGIDKNIQIDPFPFIEAARKIECEASTELIRKSRFSTRQKKRIDYSGICGKVKLRGEIGSLMPLLRAGEIFGVGKNTVFGYGEYKIEQTIS